jgi:hypothetical protein
VGNPKKKRPDTADITYNELYSLHVKFVDEFNKWVDKYKAIYKSPRKSKPDS